MFRKNTVITFGVRIFTFFLQIMRSIIAARALGPGGKGLLSIIYTTVQVVFSVIENGISLSNVYFIGQKKYREGEIFVNSLIASMVFGLGTALAFALWLAHTPSAFTSVPRYFFYIAIAMLPFSLFAQYNATLFQGRNEIIKFNILKATEPLVFFGVFVLLVEIIRLGVAGAVFANAAGIVTYSIVSLVLVFRISGLRLGFNWHVFPDSLKFGLRGHLGNIGSYLNSRFDIFMINYYTDIEYVGLYSISVIVAESLLYIPRSLAPVMFPLVAAAKRENVHQFSAIVCRNTLFMCSVLGLFLLSISGPLVKLAFGIEFAESITPLRILIPGVVVLCGTQVISSYLVGIGKPVLPSVINWVMLLVNLPVNVLVIPKWGIAGAALASTFSYGIGMFLSLFVFSELAGIRIRDMLVVKKSDFKYYTEFAASTFRKKNNG